MKIEKRVKENATILIPRGDLVYDEVRKLESIFETQNENIDNVILDLKHTTYVSAKVIGMLAFYVKQFRDKQKGLRLIHVNTGLKNLFDITGLTNIVEIFDREDEAITSLGVQVGKLEKSYLWSNK